MTVEVEWARITGPQLRELGSRPKSLAIFPVGSLEQHGPHLPVITDTASAHAAAVPGKAERFQCGKQIASYLGLVPLEKSSENQRRLGHITKQGSSMLRFCWWRRRRSQCAVSQSGAGSTSTS